MVSNTDEVETRVRTDETDEQIAAEVTRCAEEGRMVRYFNSQAMYDLWARRVAALA